MKRELITRYSEKLGQDMNVLVYGESGHPIIAFQAQDAKCNNFEDFGMVDTIADYIEEGKLQLFSVDNIDEQSWSADGDPAARAQRQEQYFAYVTDELIPLVHELNGSDLRPLATGCSMGGTHAAIAAFRRPDLFQGCIALSGVYDARRFFGGYMDSTLYESSLPTFLPNMPEDHPYIPIYAKRQLVLCVGQGAWEDQGIEDLRIIRDTCRAKNIEVWCDFWGNDVYHDWPWWKKQIRYFLPIVLDDMAKTLGEEAAEAAEAAAKAEEAKPAKKPATRRRATSTKTTAAKTTEAKTTAAKSTTAKKSTTTAKTTTAAKKTTAAAKTTATKATAAKKTTAAAKTTATKTTAAAKTTTTRRRTTTKKTEE